MNKFLSVLAVGLLAGSLSAGAMAADSAKPVNLKQGEAVSTATSNPASDAKAPAKEAHKSHKKQEEHKAK